MKVFLILMNVFMIFVSVYSYYSTATNSNIDYAEDMNISLKEDSKTGRRPTFFFSTTYRTRGPGGGGFGFGK